MTNLENKNHNSLRKVILIWWIFFWRYSVIFFLALMLNRFIFAKIGENVNSSSLIFWSKIYGNFLINIVASFVVFYLITNKKIGKFSYLLVPSNFCRQREIDLQHDISYFDIVRSWWSYFWRFILFAFIIAFALAVVVASIIKKMGYNLLEFSRYTDYIGNISVIPASLLVFILFIWRKDGKRKLELIPIKE